MGPHTGDSTHYGMPQWSLYSTFLDLESCVKSPNLTAPFPHPGDGVPYLGVTRVSSSEGCRMRQVVKVKVELVCDMHFPGW